MSERNTHTRLTMYSLVVIFCVLFFTVLVGNLLNQARLTAVEKTNSEISIRWIFDVLSTIDPTPNNFYGKLKLKDLSALGCTLSQPEPSYFDYSAKIAEALWCDVSLTSGEIHRLVQLTTLAGYNGAISIVAALGQRRQLIHLDVIRHNETPVFGGQLLDAKSGWLKSLVGSEKMNLNIGAAVELDGISGATISAKAVLGAVKEIQQLGRIEQATISDD